MRNSHHPQTDPALPHSLCPPCRPRWLASLLALLALLWGALAGNAGSDNIVDLHNPPPLQVIGRNPLDHLGQSLAVGDLNHDGWPDLVMAAPDADPNGNVSGEVFILLGRPTLQGTIDLAVSPADVRIWGGTNEGRLGYNLTLGDLNGDGIDDLIVLDYNAGPPERHTAGTTHIFFGGTPTWSQSVVDMTLATADVTLWGAVDGEHAGTLYRVVDLNGDGIDDLILGAPQSDRNRDRISNSGAVYAIYGRPDLSGSIDLLTQAGLAIHGGLADGFLGIGLDAGDLNGDGQMDLAVGARGVDRGSEADAGAVYVFLNAGQPATFIDLQTQTPDLTLWGSAGQRAGTAVAIGDVNGDGQADLLIGAPSADPQGRVQAGLVYLLFGPLDTTISQTDLALAADLILLGPQANARAGEAIALWDLGGDGMAEILINMPAVDIQDRARAGLLTILYGRTTYGNRILDLAGHPPDITVWGAEPFTRSTWSLSGTHDLNASGQPDLLIGIRDTRPANRNGAGTVYGLFDMVPSQPTITPTSTPTATAFPTSTPSRTPTPSPTPRPSATATPTTTPSPTPTASPSPTSTPTPSPSSTPDSPVFLPAILRQSW